MELKRGAMKRASELLLLALPALPQAAALFLATVATNRSAAEMINLVRSMAPLPLDIATRLEPRTTDWLSRASPEMEANDGHNCYRLCCCWPADYVTHATCQLMGTN